MILHMLRNWAQLERSQWWSHEALLEKQNRELMEIVRYAYQNVPFYRRLYDSAQVNPTGNTSSTEIGRLPFVTRQQLRDTPLRDLTAACVDVSKCMPTTTSGSTGTPVTVLDDARFAAEQEIVNLRIMLACGVRPWHRICRVWWNPGNQPPLADKLGLWSSIKERSFRRLWGTDDIHDHLKVYSVWKPDVLIALPSYYRALLWFSEEDQVKPSFKVAVSLGELLDDTTRKRIRDTFQAEVIDTYGLVEAGIVAWECPSHCGYHINVESVFVEFLKDGLPVAFDEAGKVYVTSLHRKTTPIIRYFTGDMATPTDDECSCGRGLPLMKNIQGRVIDFIVTEEGRQVSPYVVMNSLREIEGIESFKVTQKSDFSLELQVRSRAENRDELLRALRLRCLELFGQVSLDVRLVDEIRGEREPKFRPVESHLTHHSSCRTIVGEP
jgi:phenylacetate-CoA ligase